MKNPCPQWNSNPGLSAYEANALSVELLELIGAAVVESLSSWLAEQEVRGSIPGLAT